jgi:hypothetical protein
LLNPDRRPVRWKEPRMSDAVPPIVRDRCFDMMPADDWPPYHEAIQAVQDAGVPFAVGGGLAFGCYAHRARYTKDLDLFLRPADRERAVAAVRQVGFEDYHDREPYQRHWIYRGVRDGLLLDLIWQMANERAAVDDEWLARGPVVAIHGTPVRLVPVEEMVWAKLYVLQRERSDWPDVLNVLARSGPRLDWDHLVRRAGTDLPLLAAAVQVFGWLVPERASALPAAVWDRLGISPPSRDGDAERRATLLDSRDWFSPVDETSELRTRKGD